jgi:hypothetical protein
MQRSYYVAIFLSLVTFWQVVEGFCPTHPAIAAIRFPPLSRHVVIVVDIVIRDLAIWAFQKEEEEDVIIVLEEGEDSDVETHDTKSSRVSFSIHPVTTRQGALDVLTFRHGKLVPTLAEYCLHQPSSSSSSSLNSIPQYDDEMMTDDILIQLTHHTFDNSNLQQFYAILTTTTTTTTTTTDSSSSWSLFSTSNVPLLDVSLQRSNGVIGSIDALVVTTTTTSATTVEDETATAATSYTSTMSHNNNNNNNDNNAHPAIANAGVMVELKNLRVHDCVRRCGIGKALIKAVQRYSQEVVVVVTKRMIGSEGGMVGVYLEVDSDNVGAIQLYQQMGFTWDTHIANRMNWFPN